MTCVHFGFLATGDVNRLTDSDGGPVTGYAADIRIKCADCGLPFVFVGVPFGSSPNQPMVSVDGQELRAPLIEAGKRGWMEAEID